ncbi:MAG TPA: hypothetical protein VHP38_06715 [Ruminiclostridium sp.]|nr:hypothetical protein [Ruminiclostridium sp.]
METKSIMIKCILTALTALSTLSFGQITMNQMNGGTLFNFRDSLPAYDTTILRKISDKLHLSPQTSFSEEIKFKCTNWPKLGFGFACFEASVPFSKLRTDYQRYALKLKVDTSNGLNISGFHILSSESDRTMMNYGLFLNSAYLQEINPTYAHDEENFIKLQSKSSSEYWRRLTISTGYAASYLAKDNPYMGMKKFSIIATTFAEAFFYAFIPIAIYNGKNTNEKVLWSLAAYGGVWEVKLLSTWGFGKSFRLYNDFVESGYKIPKETQF